MPGAKKTVGSPPLALVRWLFRMDDRRKKGEARRDFPSGRAQCPSLTGKVVPEEDFTATLLTH
jgi:hypothetical protein